MNVILIILSVLSMIYIIWVIDTQLDKKWEGILLYLSVCIIIISLVHLISIKAEKVTAIRALEGDNPYTRHIVYEFDSNGEIVSQDTLYVKVK